MTDPMTPTPETPACRWSSARSRWETVIQPGVSAEACGHNHAPETPAGGCCCEASPPEFGGNLPDRECPIHGETPAGGLTEAEREQWDVDPDKWPHTPPFHVFRVLMDEDDNTWWRAGSGHGLNAYDAAIERVEELEQARAEDRARIEAALEGLDDNLCDAFASTWHDYDAMNPRQHLERTIKNLRFLRHEISVGMFDHDHSCCRETTEDGDRP